MNDIFRLYLSCNAYPTYFSHEHRGGHLKHIKPIRFEDLCRRDIRSFSYCWIITINIFLILGKELLHLLHIDMFWRSGLALAIVSHRIRIGNMAITYSLLHLWSLLCLDLEFLLLAWAVFLRRRTDVLFCKGVLLWRFYLLRRFWDFYRWHFLWNIEWIHFWLIFENLNSSWLLSDSYSKKITELLYRYITIRLEVTIYMLNDNFTNFSARKFFNISS